MTINLRDTGTEIGFACSKVLALSSVTLIGSLIVSGAIAVTGEFPNFKAPHRIAKMAALLMGTSAAGCILGAWMTGAIGKGEAEESKLGEALGEAERLNQAWSQKYELARDFSQAEREMSRSAIEARDNEIYRRGRKIHELRKKLYEWEAWMERCESVGDKYDVFCCKGCQHFVGSDDGGNFFVCAMHPYGKRHCADKEI